MTVNLRTVLRWLDEQRIHDEAGCWVLGHDRVEPVEHVTWTEDGDMLVLTEPPWSTPTPVPLTYREVSDILLEHYSGGGLLKWANHPEEVYKGSYVVKPESAVFFLFLSQEVGIVESHSEKMEQRKQQAIELTKRIEESQSWPTSM